MTIGNPGFDVLINDLHDKYLFLQSCDQHQASKYLYTACIFIQLKFVFYQTSKICPQTCFNFSLN